MQLSESKTLENLKTAFANESAAMVRYEIFAEKAMHGENYEWTQMYKEYAETARQEGLDNIADLFEKVGDIEKEHESRFKLFVNKLTDGSLFTSCGETVWLCRNCGHIHCGSTPPEYCPVCRKPQGYFQRKDDSILS